MQRSVEITGTLDLRLLRAAKVVDSDTSRSGTYDFLLVIHSNYGPISYRFRDTRRFQLEITYFPTPVFNALLSWFPWNWVTPEGLKQPECGLPGQERGLTIYHLDTIHERDGQTD